MDPTFLYACSLLGAGGVYFLIRPSEGSARLPVRTLGAVLGVAALIGLLVRVPAFLAESGDGAAPDRPAVQLFALVFAFIAIASAVRVICTSRPVYTALYFVLVVLASAGLFLLFEAEFMAFAMIIVYAGAILVTYMFVLMLAQQATVPDDEQGQADYDRTPREPVAGALVGFLLLAMLSRVLVEGQAEMTPRVAVATARAEAWHQLSDMPVLLRRHTRAAFGEEEFPPADADIALRVDDDGIDAHAVVTLADGTVRTARLDHGARPDNVQSVGLALVMKFPASLEIAGVILLMAMFGAVILARRQIEISEDEKRQSAGLMRVGIHDDLTGGTPENGGNAP